MLKISKNQNSKTKTSQHQTKTKAPPRRSLRLGPLKPNFRNYQASESYIRRVLDRALSKRRISLRGRELCREAGISSPTFYLHSRGCDDALRAYEKSLIAEFHNNIRGKPAQKEVIFLVLLEFIAQNHHYFAATLVQHNNWLIYKIITSVRANLINNSIPDKSFDLYVDSLTSLIFCWGKYENFNTDKIPFYTQKLMQTRVMNLGI